MTGSAGAVGSSRGATVVAWMPWGAIESESEIDAAVASIAEKPEKQSRTAMAQTGKSSSSVALVSRPSHHPSTP